MTSPVSHNDLVARLRAVPTRISTAFGKKSVPLLYAAPARDEWSASHIIAHIRASDDIMSYRAYMILARDNPLLPAFDDRRWEEVAAYAQRDVLNSLQIYTLRREELAQMLHDLPPGAWARTGIHEQVGQLTLLDVLTTLVEHEEEHCAQIEATLAVASRA